MGGDSELEAEGESKYILYTQITDYRWTQATGAPGNDHLLIGLDRLAAISLYCSHGRGA